MGRGSWHLDKKVPISLLFGMFVQAMAFAWWASAYTARNDAENVRQNDDIRDLKTTTASFNEMKSDVAVIKSNMVDIKLKLDKIH